MTDQPTPEAEKDEDGVCPECRGTGKALGQTCARCNGTGKLTEGIGQ